MTFSNRVKKEITSIKFKNKIEALLELSSIIKSNASISIRNAFINISLTTESEDVAKRIYRLVDYLYNYECVITRYENNSILKNGIYGLFIEDESIVNKIIAGAGFDIYGNYTESIDVLSSRILSGGDRTISAYFRGLFMGSGYIVDPDKNYNLELIFSNRKDAKLAYKIFEKLEIYPLYKERKEKYILYFKNSENISEFLLLIGATNAMLELENIKVEKDIKNNINRRMNFEMANMNKTLNTSLKQIEDIKLVMKYENIGDDLIKIAEIRINNPEYSLQQIADAINPPLTKSNVAYKLKKISNLAEKIKKEKKFDKTK